MSWNLFKKWQSKVTSSEMFPNAFLCLWHHLPGDRNGEKKTKCYVTCQQVTDPGSTLGLDSNLGWLPCPLLHPSPCLCREPVCKIHANKCSSLGLGWWSRYVTGVASGNSPLGVATCSPHILLQSAIRGITILLPGRLVTVTDWQTTQPSTLHDHTDPINTKCLS